MLMMSPAGLKAKRKEERRERERRKGRLGHQRFEALAKKMAHTIQLAFEAGMIGSLFGLEGTLRAGIRSDLCLQGWRWQDANDVAKLLVDEALRIARAERPSWYEGQPEWTIRERLLIERTRCIKCHKPLPPENHKFCSYLCGHAYRENQRLKRNASEDTAVRIATKSI